MTAASNPHEAWHQRAVQVREELALLSDEELIERIQRRQVDLTFGIWDTVRERGLGAKAVGEIMNLLIEVPTEASDHFLHFYHAAVALLKMTGFPCEMSGGGDFNQTANRLASDFRGEPHRQQQLRDFWPELVAHCAGNGVQLGAEPEWPTTFFRYHSTANLRRHSSAEISANPDSVRARWRNENQDKLKTFLPPESGDSITFTRREEDGREIEQVMMRYGKSRLEVSADILVRDLPNGAWEFPVKVAVRYASDGASVGASSITASHDSPLFDLFYLPDF